MAAAQNRQHRAGRDLTDEDVVEVLGKQIKQRRESIEHSEAAGREAMAEVEEAEAAIIAEFLPEPLTEERSRSWSAAAIAETGAIVTGRPRQGDGPLAPQTKGRADGKAVADIVRRLLAAAEPMFIPRTLAETEGGGGARAMGPRR